jgi:hypothetical protein
MVCASSFSFSGVTGDALGMDRPGAVVFFVGFAASSAAGDEEDSNELIPSEFIPMGPEQVFRSGAEAWFRS